jgi:outer membrane autotransporter protein
MKVSSFQNAFTNASVTACLLSVSSAMAVDRTWNAATASWTTGANWTPAAVPGAADRVFINNAGVAQVNSNAEAQSLFLGSTAIGSGTIEIFTGGLLAMMATAGTSATIGNSGSGALRISNGGRYVANTSSTTVGNASGSNGTLSVLSGGTYNSVGLTIGSASGATGTMAVSGAGSTATMSNAFVVGSSGSGTLNIDNGGRVIVSSGTFFVGRNAGSNGIVNIDGIGSRLDASTTNPSIGSAGHGELHITNGGVFTQSGSLTTGQTGGSAIVTIDGAGSQMDIGGILYIGNGGTSTATLSNGAFVHSRGFRIGNPGTGTLAIDGAGTEYLTDGANHYIGMTSGGTVNVNNGGTLTANDGTLYIGNDSAGNGFLNIDGSGSKLRGSSTVVAGQAGTAQINIANNGSIATTGNFVLGNQGGTGIVTVDGAGASVSSNALAIGLGGRGSFNLINGATLSVANNILLASSGVSSGTLNIGDGDAAGAVSAASVVGGNGAGTVNFNHGDPAYTFSAPMLGKLGVNQVGAGRTILTGDSSYAGLTTISAGTLQLGNGGATGGITGDILNNASLVIDRSNTFLYGGVIQGTGRVLQNGNGTTVFTGDNLYTGGTAISNGVLQLGNGGETGSVAGDIVNNADLFINRSNTYNYSGLISGSGNLTVDGGGSLGLSQQQSYAGATLVRNGTLRAGVPDVISASSGLTLLAGGIFHQGGFNQTLANLDNAGLVDMRGASAGNRLTVPGSYIGRNGVIAMNTALLPAGAPSDQIVIDSGSATGSTALRIYNTSNGGARTTGNGVLVVNAINGGTTAASAFNLGQRVVGGPYEYGLFRGGTGSADNWYLRTTGIRGETSLYPVLPAMGILYGGKLLDTLDQRWGAWLPDDEFAPIHVASNSDTGISSLDRHGASEIRRLPEGTWGRVIYQHGERDGMAHGVTGVGASFTHDFYAMQGGIDLYRDKLLDGHRVFGGVYGAIGRGEGEVTHFDGAPAGDNSFNAYTLGGYWTHFGPQNWYLDAILQVTWYDAKGKGANSTQTLTTDGIGYSASLEGGYPFKFNSGWLIEPQAQLVGSRLKLQDSSDAGGSVNFDAGNSLMGRVGARVARSWNAGRPDAPLMRSVWARLSSWREFRNTARVNFQSEAGPVGYDSNNRGDWWEINTGFTAQVGKSSYLTANLGYYKSYDGRRHAADARIGLKVNW